MSGMSGGLAEAAGPVQPLLWTAEQVCAALACRRSWLYDEVEAGRFPAVRLGRQLRFRPADVIGYLDAHTSHARDPERIHPGPRRRRQRRATST